MTVTSLIDMLIIIDKVNNGYQSTGRVFTFVLRNFFCSVLERENSEGYDAF